MKIIRTSANISYTALVFDDPQIVLNNFQIPKGWETIAHHVTLNMGPAKNPELVGKRFTVTINKFAEDDKVMAAGVIMPSNLPTVNAIPHTTLAVNRQNGGKPFLSNKLTNWKDISNFTVTGIVKEVAQLF